MPSLIEECTSALRQKTHFWLIDGETTLRHKNLYPFQNDKLPVMCNFAEHMNYPTLLGFESGNRSILLPCKEGWFKAKGIGIPEGISQPIFRNNNIYTYHLSAEERMCHTSILWGFMEKEEAESEVFGNDIAESIGMPAFLVGGGCYNNVNYSSFSDTQELFAYLHKKDDSETLDKRYNETSRKTEAFCTFSIVPSDLRVDEILYGFMLPYIEQAVDMKNCKDYIRWLGSNCAQNLRILHDNGILHGTYFVPKWSGGSMSHRVIHSNAYTGNHVISETKTWIVDYDLARLVEEESKSSFDDEIESLTYLQNPLMYGEYYKSNSLKNEFRETLANEFREGVSQGYQNDLYEVEDKFKREMLRKLTRIKKTMWNLFELPSGLTRARDYLEYVITKKKISKEDFKKEVEYSLDQ